MAPRTVVSLFLVSLAGLPMGQSSSSVASCSHTLTASYPAPSVADGYVAKLVANGLSDPRSIKFDSQGTLLVVEANSGIVALSLADAGQDCVSVSSTKTVLNNTALTHGIELSPDGRTLYASSADTLWSWDYSAASQTNTSAPRTLIENMSGTDHTTRTLLLSKFAPGLIVVCRGSTSNIDPDAEDITTGHSQIKAFNLTNLTDTYDFTSDGLLLGWGLRNEVGIAEEPTQGGIYGVENSADQIARVGVDIHQDNPAEELNYLGTLINNTSPNQGRNFGYPLCFTAWDTSIIPDFNGTVGQQFAIDGENNVLSNSTLAANDTFCDEANHQQPRLSFQAHMAPLDILFNDAGTAAWITFHGSWDRTDPVGYKLSVVEFAGGAPTHASNSTTAAVDIMSNRNNTACPTGCFRPVGLAWDTQGRLFMSSDTTGEIYMITRADGNATSGAGSNATGTIPSPTGTTSSGGASPTSSTSSANAVGVSVLALMAGLVAVLL